MYKVEFTEQEKDVLFNLLDAANRAQGINAAENCVYLVKKVLAGKQEASEKEEINPLEVVKS